MFERTRCGLIAEAIGDEEKAAEMYDKMRGTLGKGNNEKIAEIESEEIVHKSELKKIYKALCINSSDNESREAW